MKTEHTSTPWVAAVTYHHGEPAGACVRSGARRVADCEDGLTQDECEANARLCAAAPELLQSLKDAVGCLKACLDELGGSTRDSVEQDLRHYEAAIAKATQPPSEQ